MILKRKSLEFQAGIVGIRILVKRCFCDSGEIVFDGENFLTGVTAERKEGRKPDGTHDCGSIPSQTLCSITYQRGSSPGRVPNT